MRIKQLQAVADRTATILTAISAALLAVMFLTNIAQIVLRPITGGLIWVNDLSRLLFAWVIMLGAAAAFGKHEHLIVDVLVNVFPRRTRKFALVLSRVLQVGVGALLVLTGLIVAAGRMNIQYIQLGIPSGYAYYAEPVLGVFMILFGLVTPLEPPDREELPVEAQLAGSTAEEGI